MARPVQLVQLVLPVFDRVCQFNSNPVFSITRNRIDGRVTVRPAGPVRFSKHWFQVLKFKLKEMQ
ncbi:hypothetical protein YC2023_016299 [Brassica napus]